MIKRLTPLRAIRLYCKQTCCSGDRKSWTDCSLKDCPLYNFRFGKKSLPETSLNQSVTAEPVRSVLK